MFVGREKVDANSCSNSVVGETMVEMKEANYAKTRFSKVNVDGGENLNCKSEENPLFFWW